jgi:hypothetical protein
MTPFLAILVDAEYPQMAEGGVCYLTLVILGDVLYRQMAGDVGRPPMAADVTSILLPGRHEDAVNLAMVEGEECRPLKAIHADAIFPPMVEDGVFIHM